MANPKTLAPSSKPQVHNGWIRKSDLDAWLDRHLPVPTQVVSNEEYTPIPQTPQQRLVEQEIVARAERQAHRAWAWTAATSCELPVGWLWPSPP